jgi:hypothetical protein
VTVRLRRLAGDPAALGRPGPAGGQRRAESPNVRQIPNGTRMLQIRRPLLALLLLVSAPGLLPAQTVPSPFRHIETRHSGGLYAGQFAMDPGRLELGPRAAPIIGGRYDIRLTGPLSGEVGIGFSNTQRMLYTRTGPALTLPIIELGETDFVLMLGEAGLRFHLTGPRTWRGFAPYGVATVGVAADLTRNDPREEGIPVEQRFDFGPSFAAGGGLGTDFFLNERFSIRAEARDYFWRLTYPGGLTATGLQENQWRHNVAVTLGGAFHF